MPNLFTQSSAIFSSCGRYRYALDRVWDAEKALTCWLMLNPSTADADQDDPTIRRCIGFSRAWGAGGVVVVNLFALRSTDPSELYRPYVYPVSSTDEPAANDMAILRATECRRIIAAWGVNGAWMDRGAEVMRLLAGRFVECLGVSKRGHPLHPLYQPGDAVPRPFELAEVKS